MANKYNGAEDNRAKLKKASTEEELNELLIQLDKEWNETKEKYEPMSVEELFPVEHGYTYKEYKPESDESIATRVENELRPVSESKKQQLRAAAQGEERKEESRRDEAEAENESQKKSIAKARKEEYDDIENAAVAQGIGRSSIKSGLEGETDRSAIAAYEASDSELALKEAEIDANQRSGDRREYRRFARKTRRGAPSRGRRRSRRYRRAHRRPHCRARQRVESRHRV